MFSGLPPPSITIILFELILREWKDTALEGVASKPIGLFFDAGFLFLPKVNYSLLSNDSYWQTIQVQLSSQSSQKLRVPIVLQ